METSEPGGYVDDLSCGDLMAATMDKDDIFVDLDMDSGDLSFHWDNDNESRMIVEGDLGSVEQISGAKNNDPQTEHVRMDRDMEPPHLDDTQLIQAVPEEQARERKKRVRWTVREHKLFLMGYKNYKNKWKIISKLYIPWKTPSQLASHAQKYLQRQGTPVDNWKKNTINNFSGDDLTPEDYSRLAPHQRPPPATVSRPRSDGGLSIPPQQPLHATMQERYTCGSSSMQQSFGVPMQGSTTEGFVPTWHQTNTGGHMSSHRQPIPHLGTTQRIHPSQTFYPRVDAWMQTTQPVTVSPEYYYHQAPPMQCNNNVNLESPVQHPFFDTEGLYNLFMVPTDYRACYGLNR